MGNSHKHSEVSQAKMMYGLVDCNNSYVSFERVFNPLLKNKPVIVLSNNDGCAIARSNEAKALGIKMGDAYFLIKDIIKQHNIQVLSSNYTLYADMSNRVMTLLKEFTPDVEVYSIDEAFLGFRGFQNFSLDEIGYNIQRTLLKGMGVPVSVGFAPTKALAKIANKIAKKFPERTNNSYVIDTEEKRIKALRWTKIEDVWGIGRQHGKNLMSMGVTTAYEFTKLNRAFVKKHFSIVGLRLWYDLNGRSAIQAEKIQDKQNIACTRAFDFMISDFEIMQERISTYTTTVAVKLRNQKSNCEIINVFVRSNSHRQDLAQYNASYSIKLPFPTSSTFILNKYAQMALKLIYQDGYQYKKAGVNLMAISKDEGQQLSMFEYEDPRHKVLMSVIDNTNKRMLGEKIKFGRNDLNRKWRMRQDFLSKRFTTKLSEVITANAI